jgi:hypothetical protein
LVARITANYRDSCSVKAGFYLLTTPFHVNPDIWAKRTLPLPGLEAASQDTHHFQLLKDMGVLTFSDLFC